MFNRRIAATILAAVAAAVGARPGPAFDSDFPATPGGRYRKTTYFPPERRNGERECARRRRQMTNGTHGLGPEGFR